MSAKPSKVSTLTHWGVYDLTVENDRVAAAKGNPRDPDPSPIAESLAGTLDDVSRIRQPMVRKSYLERGVSGALPNRGREPFVAVSWRDAELLVANELQRIRGAYGSSAIYGGSYGWASAGRFHHAQSQLHRFLNCVGGYTRSVDSYSLAAGEVILPHVLGDSWRLVVEPTSWPSIIKHGQLMVCFGGMPLKNAQIDSGGMAEHRQRGYMRDAKEAGLKFVNLSPIKDDTAGFLDAQWLPLAPNTDVAVMSGLAHTLLTENLYDDAFLIKYCVGHQQLFDYLLGKQDGTPKDAEWAAEIAGLTPDSILALAREMAAKHTMISVSWSLTRQDHGEQPFWMAVSLAAMLGQIGLPGGGVAFGYSAVNKIGNRIADFHIASLPAVARQIDSFIPVARVADMLLHPGEAFSYNGKQYDYPAIRFIYWAGGNPFHHHQDLNRLHRAWQRPDTIVCHEIWWNATARHADIVLPATSPLERNDIGGASGGGFVQAMPQAVEATGEARNDYSIFAALAQHMGVEQVFTEGRDENQWLRELYRKTQHEAARRKMEMPDFNEFWRQGSFVYPESRRKDNVMLAAFRQDPKQNPLNTPSGLIELFSEKIAGFQYRDCPGHATWLEPAEWLGAGISVNYPLHLVSNQPATRLHSQLDNGTVSRASKIGEREPVRVNPRDAAARKIVDGDVVLISNKRGSILAGVIISDQIRPGVIQMATGAWWDPEFIDGQPAMCRHGNVNALTLDKGTSSLAQGPSALSCLVEMSRFTEEPPAVQVFAPPPAF